MTGRRSARSTFEYALSAEQLSEVQSENPFHTAVFLAAYRLDVHQGSGVEMVGPPADVLAATEVVQGVLRRVAEHVAQSPHTDWWSTGAVLTEQSTVEWIVRDAEPFGDSAERRSAAEVLSAWAVRTAVDEERAARERPADPAARVGEEWWSTPPTLCSSRLLAVERRRGCGSSRTAGPRLG